MNAETRDIYDGWRVIQERDTNSGLPTVSYTRGSDLSGSMQGAGGIGGLLARSSGYSAGNWTSHADYFADGNGDVTYMLDSSQAMVASYRYDPFGNTISKSGSLADANVYRFSSKEIHTASGLYYYGFRFYDPNLQRWINRDPLQERYDLNLYRYIYNSPLDYSDPTGCGPVGTGVGAGIGLVTGEVVGGIVGAIGGTLVLPGGGTIAGAEGLGTAGAIAGAALGAAAGNLIENISDYFHQPHPRPAPPIICNAEKAPGQPAAADGYTPPKRGPGSDGSKVKNPNGPGWGWAADDGGVWVPTGEGPLAHGGPHWDVQYPGGNYKNVYPINSHAVDPGYRS